MDWGAFKQEIDNALYVRLGPGFDENSVEVDYIDVGSYEVSEIEIIVEENHTSLRVT